MIEKVMLEVKILCSQCARVTIFWPSVQKEFTIENLTCANCKSWIGEFIHKSLEAMKEDFPNALKEPKEELPNTPEDENQT